jgi:hypothetical protein
VSDSHGDPVIHVARSHGLDNAEPSIAHSLPTKMRAIKLPRDYRRGDLEAGSRSRCLGRRPGADQAEAASATASI